MKTGTAILIGAGPAGLTAALELQRHTAIKPIVVESSHALGGISRTVCYRGNRMDIGGHRFFSKSDRVMQWWLELMPVEAGAAENAQLCYRGRKREIPATISAAPDPHAVDLVMLVRQRKSRIYFRRRFLDYPIRLNPATLRSVGALGTLRCGLSYLRATIFPRREERTLEDFLVNRFGRQLYRTFFKAYTEKVWGVPCNALSAEWGAQRVKGLSLKSVAAHFLKKSFTRNDAADLAQKREATSLIERFLYPKLGAGQMWEHVAGLVSRGGGEIHFGVVIDRIYTEGNRVIAVEGVNQAGERSTFAGDYFFSTMLVRDLIRAFTCTVPEDVAAVSENLVYRDLISVGLLVRRLALAEPDGSPLRDNWIYIHEPEVAVGRVQIFNNWSPWLVSNPNQVWIGLEFFCNRTDTMWSLSDAEMSQVAVAEAVRIGLLHANDVEDAHVVRVPEAYPAYSGSYNRFEAIRRFTDGFENLFLVGRNGMHKYNNQDHSMLTAMTAVENIANGVTDKGNIWAINTEMEHHEETAKN